MGFFKKMIKKINRPLRKFEKHIIRPVAGGVKKVLSKVEEKLPGITSVPIPVSGSTMIGVNSGGIAVSTVRKF